MNNLGTAFEAEDTDKGINYDNSLIQRGIAARREREQETREGGRGQIIRVTIYAKLKSLPLKDFHWIFMSEGSL